MRGAYLLPLLGLTGCLEAFGDKDALHPGDPLGTFHVAAQLSGNSCGDGALGAGPSWEFDVKLSHTDGQIFWDNGQEIIQGSLATDHVSFSFSSGTVTNMRPSGPPPETVDEPTQLPGDNLPPCSVARTDGAAGVLGGTDGLTAFTGSIGYAFAPTEGSNCSDIVAGGATPLFASLPCSATYAMNGTRTEAPPETP